MRFDGTTAPETHSILGAAIDVQRQLGTGLLESAYGDAFRADFVCHGSTLLELKASSGLGNVDLAQMGHYLALTGLTTGLLINFARAPMQIRRFVRGAVEPVSLDSLDSAVPGPN